jgi:hypothetical protein
MRPFLVRSSPEGRRRRARSCSSVPAPCSPATRGRPEILPGVEEDPADPPLEVSRVSSANLGPHGELPFDLRRLRRSTARQARA